MFSWNTTIDDSSSILGYTPFSDGSSLSGGWMPWYSDYPGNFIKKPGDDSEGTSIHYTSTPGANVVLQFEGSAVYVYGSANCSYMVSVDSTPYPGTLNQSSVGLLFAKEGLDTTAHTVNLTVLSTDASDQLLGFDQITVTNTINENVDGLIPVRIDNTNTTALQYTGKWNTSFDSQIPSKAAPAKYSITSDPEASVSLNVTEAVAVAINANRNWGHWTYNVSLGGDSIAYNSSTYWLIGDAVLFYQTLIPSETYQVTLTNTGNQDYYQMTLNAFTVWMPNTTNLEADPSSSTATSRAPSTSASSPAVSDSTKSHSKVNVGVIVGPIVGVVAAALLGVAFFLRWRRRRTITAVASPSPPETVAPFPRTTRAELWYKGMEADPNASPPVPYVVPVTSGKRAQMAQIRAQPPPASAETATAMENRGTVWSTDPPSTAPQSAAVQQSPVVSQAPLGPQVVDVDRIIELIAQRIDPAGAGRSNDDIAPPQYLAI